jgi:hypothetical protein
LENFEPDLVILIVDGAVVSYQAQQPNLSIPCVGAKRYGLFQDYELIFTIPCELSKTISDSLFIIIIILIIGVAAVILIKNNIRREKALKKIAVEENSPEIAKPETQEVISERPSEAIQLSTMSDNGEEFVQRMCRT